MTLISFLLLLAIAGICGAIDQAISGFQGGFLVSIAVGFIGALIGVWLAGVFGVREIFAEPSAEGRFRLSGHIGSALFAALIGLLRRRRYSRYV